MTTKTIVRQERRARSSSRLPRQRTPVGRTGRWALIAGLLVAVAVLAAIFGPWRDSGGGALSTLQTADFHALAISPQDPNVVLFGHHNGLLRSLDGGRSWAPLVERRNFDAMGLAVSGANSRQVFLAGHDVFQASADGGATWQPVAHDLPGTDIHGFAMSPDDPARLFAFVVGHGVSRSADAGRTWQRVEGQTPADLAGLAAAGNETLYAASVQAGVLRSDDGGRSWTASGSTTRGAQALAVDPAARQTVYAGLSSGLAKSTDGGATWSRVPSFPGGNVATLAISPSRPNVLLAISVKNHQQGLVFRSNDGGQTWSS